MTEITDVPRIAELPATLASQIAAGEVIERPAAIVKELVENSLDAGARQIDIAVAEGGRKRVAVSDDGHGIHPDDMELALRRHSTSKLNRQSDLDCIASLGFRGEALASIAAVSRFSLTSRPAQAEAAWRLSFEPVSGNAALKPAARPPGTTVEAVDIFQALPARRKFLRARRTEFARILDAVKRAACSHFGVGFALTHDDKPVLRYPACRADLGERVAQIFGAQFVNKALLVERESQGMKLWGWLGGGDLSRNQSDRQFWFVNGRAVQDKHLLHAARAALGEALPTGRYLSCLLHLELDPAVVDVNVHPAKSEIRFRAPRDAHDFVSASLRRALQAAHRLDLGGAVEPSPASAPAAASAPATGGAPPAAGARPAGPASRPPSPPAAPAQGPERRPLQVEEAGAFYESLKPRQEQGDLIDGAPSLGAPVAALGPRLMLAQRGEEWVLIDAHAIANQVLLRQFEKACRGSGPRRRPLLVPVEIKASPKQLELVGQHGPALEALGLELRVVAADAILIKGIPALLEEADVKQLTRAALAGLGRLRDSEDPGPALRECLVLGRGERTDVPTRAELRALLKDLDSVGVDTTAKRRKGLWRVLSIAELRRLLDAA